MADDVLNLAGRFHSTADDNKALDAIEVFDSTRDDKRQKHFNDDIVRLDEQINNTDGLKDRLEAVEDMAHIQLDGGDVQIAPTITPSTEGGKIPTVDAVKGHATAKSTFTTDESVDSIGIDSEPTSGSDNLVKSQGIKTAIDNVAFSTNEKVNTVGIDSEPTNNGRNLIISGAVYSSIKDLKINESYSLPYNNLQSYAGAINSTGNFNVDEGFTHKVIPVNAGQVLTIKTGTNIGYFGIVKSLPDNSTPGYKTVDYATGESARQLPSSETSYTIPSDGKYVIIPELVINVSRRPTVLKLDGYDILLGVDNLSFSTGQKVINTKITGLIDGGANNILSAEEGKLNILYKNYEIDEVIESNKIYEQFNDLPIGSTIINLGNRLNVYSDSNTYITYHQGDVSTITGSIYKLEVLYVDEPGYYTGHRAHFIVNQNTLVIPNDFITKSMIKSTTQLGTSTQTISYASSGNWSFIIRKDILIPKNSRIHIEISEGFLDLLTSGSGVKLYINNMDSVYATLRNTDNILTVNTDVTLIALYIGKSTVSQTGDVSITAYFDDVLNSIPKVIDSLNSTSEVDALSANQGRILEQKTRENAWSNNYHFVEELTGSKNYGTLFSFLPIGTKILNYGNTIRIYYDSTHYNDYPGNYDWGGNEFTVTTEIYSFRVIGAGKADFIINPKDKILGNDTINSTDVFQDRVYFANNKQVPITQGVGTFYINWTDCNIPKGSKIVIDFGPSNVMGNDTEAGNLIKDYTVQINESETFVYERNIRINTLIATNNINRIRVFTPSSHNIASGTATFTMYVERVREKIDNVVKNGYKEGTYESLVEYAKRYGMYDEVNNVFTEGTLEMPLYQDSNAISGKQMMISAFAKYSSSNESYPTISLYSITQNNFQTRWNSILGSKDTYALTETTKLPLLKKDNQDHYDIVQIIIPTGVTVNIEQFSYEPVGPKTKGFKVFSHGSYYNNETSTAECWNYWKYSNPYGAIVIPKRTTDGVWVCYHDDETMSSNNNMQLIGGSALPEDIASKTMNQLSWSEVQTLEYKTANLWGTHPRVPKLEDFFAECAKQGLHPCLSIHPSWDATKWGEIKEISDRYKLTDKLTIKGSLNSEVAQIIYSVWGNEIESYFPDAEITEENVNILLNSGFDKTKVVLGLEKIVNGTAGTYGWMPDATTRALLDSNGVYWGLAPVFDNPFDDAWIKAAIRAGMYEFTNDYFFSNGLCWGGL